MYKRTRRLSKNFEEYCVEEDSPYPTCEMSGEDIEVEDPTTPITRLFSQSSDVSSSTNYSNETYDLTGKPISQEQEEPTRLSITVVPENNDSRKSYSSNGNTSDKSNPSSGKSHPTLSRTTTPTTKEMATMVNSATMDTNQVPDFLQNAAAVSVMYLILLQLCFYFS